MQLAFLPFAQFTRAGARAFDLPPAAKGGPPIGERLAPVGSRIPRRKTTIDPGALSCPARRSRTYDRRPIARHRTENDSPTKGSSDCIPWERMYATVERKRARKILSR